VELSNLPLAELKTLLDLIPVEIKRREKAERAQALKDLEALAIERGFTLAELVERKKERKARAPVSAKYRNPENSSVTWTGRGRQPHWVSGFVANGGTLAELEIEKKN